MKPHKHAEVIKKWADGHQIQFRHNPNESWADILDPAWNIDAEYRVKPAVRWYALYKDCPGHAYYDSEEDALKDCASWRGFIKVVSTEI